MTFLCHIFYMSSGEIRRIPKQVYCLEACPAFLPSMVPLHLAKRVVFALPVPAGVPRAVATAQGGAVVPHGALPGARVHDDRRLRAGVEAE